MTKSDLSAASRVLLDKMGDIQFGLIEGLAFRDGQPVFTPAPRVVRHIKLGANHEAHPRGDDFELKAAVVDLFRRMAELRNGRVRSLEIRHGLPVAMLVEEEG